MAMNGLDQDDCFVSKMSVNSEEDWYVTAMTAMHSRCQNSWLYAEDIKAVDKCRKPWKEWLLIVDAATVHKC